MQSMMAVTHLEWVLLALAGIALVHSAVTCMQLRRDLIKADERPAFRGLSKALSDVPKRAQLKAPKN